MKNLLLFLLLSTSVAFAQVEKPTSGEMFEVSFMPNLEGTTQFALTDMHMVYRKFTDASSVTRWKSHFSYSDIDGDSASSQATAAFRALNSDGFDTIAMNGTTTGTVGTAFRITNIAADRWYVTGHIAATGAPSTPFVAS